MTSSPKKDLIILVADKSMECAIKGLLGRPQALGIRPITWDVYTHVWRDPGCRSQGVNFLRTFIHSHQCCMILHDKEGCGEETKSRATLELELESKLAASGWKNASVIVMDPELESWVWSVSPHVGNVLGWKDNTNKIRDWLCQRGFIRGDDIKPRRPKEAMEAVLRFTRKAKSSSLFTQLAENVSFERCVDPAFIKFKKILTIWFPIQAIQLRNVEGTSEIVN